MLRILTKVTMQVSPFARYAQQEFTAGDAAQSSIELTQQPRSPASRRRSASPLPRPGHERSNTSTPPASTSTPPASVAIDILPTSPAGRFSEGRESVRRPMRQAPASNSIPVPHGRRPRFIYRYYDPNALSSRILAAVTCVAVTAGFIFFAVTVVGILVCKARKAEHCPFKFGGTGAFIPTSSSV